MLILIHDRLPALVPLLALIAALALAAGGVGSGGAEAAKPDAPRAPALDAAAWLLIDERDGTRLVGADARRELPIASATKLMTAYLALAELDLGRELRAADYDAAPAESVLGLEAGERISVRDLLVALMLASANDAAVTLAEGVSGSVPRFVARMNRAARKLGLAETSYANPVGLDDRDNHSSARDLADLARVLAADERFTRIVAKPEATLKSGSGARRKVESRNSLLRADRSVDGVKTGHTLGAGYVLVASAERGGVPLISVVLGAESEAARDSESERLLDYGFGLYRERDVVAAGERLAEVAIDHEAEPLGAVAGRRIRVSLAAGQRPQVEVEAPTKLEGPLEAGEPIGSVRASLGGRPLGRSPLRAERAVAAPSVLEDVSSPAATILIVGGSILVAAGFLLSVRRRQAATAGARTEEERMRSQRERSRNRERGGRGR